MVLLLKFIIILFLASSVAVSAEPHEERYWEFGVGMGFVRYEQYPAAGKYTELFLPVPTFQYRGRTVRADDREGAKAYIFKGDHWSIHMSGTGSPYLKSKDNEARKDMDDIPWIGAVGPEYSYMPNSELNFSFGTFQAIATDFDMTRFSGVIFQGRATYSIYKTMGENIRSYTKFYITLKNTSSEVQKYYFGVDAQDETPNRPKYKAKAGFLDTQVSVFQSFKAGKWAYYIGANYAYYGSAVNKKSPLHKSDDQFNYLAGITYVIGESKRPSVPDEDTSGIINRK